MWNLLYLLIFVIHSIILSQNKLSYLAFKDFGVEIMCVEILTEHTQVKLMESATQKCWHSTSLLGEWENWAVRGGCICLSYSVSVGDTDSRESSSTFFVISFCLTAHVRSATKTRLQNHLAAKPAEGKQQMHQVSNGKLLTVELEFVDWCWGWLSPLGIKVKAYIILQVG